METRIETRRDNRAHPQEEDSHASPSFMHLWL